MTGSYSLLPKKSAERDLGKILKADLQQIIQNIFLRISMACFYYSRGIEFLSPPMARPRETGYQENPRCGIGTS